MKEIRISQFGAVTKAVVNNEINSFGNGYAFRWNFYILYKNFYIYMDKTTYCVCKRNKIQYKPLYNIDSVAGGEGNI